MGGWVTHWRMGGWVTHSKHSAVCGVNFVSVEIYMTQFQIEGGGAVQGVTKLF